MLKATSNDFQAMNYMAFYLFIIQNIHISDKKTFFAH